MKLVCIVFFFLYTTLSQPLLDVAVFRGTQCGCGIVQSFNQMACWGSGFPNDNGQCIPAQGQFSQFSPGDVHVCALRTGSGSMECWGKCSWNNCNPPSGVLFTFVSAGGTHTCGVTLNGTIICFGNNQDGQCDAPLGSFSAVHCGALHTCALTDLGAILCWAIFSSLTALKMT